MTGKVPEKIRSIWTESQQPSKRLMPFLILVTNHYNIMKKNYILKKLNAFPNSDRDYPQVSSALLRKLVSPPELDTHK
jgi:hypothetical protein